mmetsp:Transcript_109879/g.311623  ORF Transcript_109879/g.311623 Transcript_109879/m.311623 type:complete len:200 (-) Transcript_109879:93-692(-)
MRKSDLNHTTSFSKHPRRESAESFGPHLEKMSSLASESVFPWKRLAQMTARPTPSTSPWWMSRTSFRGVTTTCHSGRPAVRKAGMSASAAHRPSGSSSTPSPEALASSARTATMWLARSTSTLFHSPASVITSLRRGCSRRARPAFERTSSREKSGSPSWTFATTLMDSRELQGCWARNIRSNAVVPCGEVVFHRRWMQ